MGSENLKIYVEIEGIQKKLGDVLSRLKKVPKVKKIIRDGYGYNYGIKSELSQKAKNNHVLWIQETKLAAHKKLAEIFARLEQIVDEI